MGTYKKNSFLSQFLCSVKNSIKKVLRSTGFIFVYDFSSPFLQLVTGRRVKCLQYLLASPLQNRDWLHSCKAEKHILSNVTQNCASFLHGGCKEELATFHQGGEFRLCGLWQGLVQLLGQGHHAEEEEQEEDAAEDIPCSHEGVCTARSALKQIVWSL